MAVRNNNNVMSSPRRGEMFPHGLRVLVVDDDLTWLKIIAKMLKKCFYEVTTCCLAREALNILCQRKDGFDIVISDVNMPDMDGFKLLEFIGLEMDLPVIMMSVDGETSRVMKGIQHGACDYLLKPIRMKELRNIWQHVVRKKINEVRDIECLKGIEKLQVMRSGTSDQSGDGYFFCGDDQNLVKKRKGSENKHDDKEFADPSLVKKIRVVWDFELHQKFVKAVNHIGIDEIGPKKILDLMDVPWLTRENVASHLQKYRLYLSRLQGKSNLKVLSGTNQYNLSSKELARNIGIPGNNFVIENSNSNSYENETRSILSLPMIEFDKSISSDICEIREASSSSGTDVVYAFESPHANYSTLSSIIPPSPGTETFLEFTSVTNIGPDLEIKNDFSNDLFPTMHSQIFSSPSTHAMYTTPFQRQIDNLSCLATNAPNVSECSNQHITQQTQGFAFGQCPVQPNNYITTCFPSEANTISTWTTKNQVMEQKLAYDLSSITHLTYFESQNNISSKDFTSSSNLELLTDVPPYFYYDKMKLNCENYSEPHMNFM